MTGVTKGAAEKKRASEIAREERRSMELVSDQEKHWADPVWAQGYMSRNKAALLAIKRVPFWTDTLNITQARSVLEVGCNVGANLRAMRTVDRQLELKGIDVSYDACIEAVMVGLDVEQVRAADVGRKWPEKFDLCATVGVLIHISDADLSTVMDSIIAASKRYVLAVEYESDHTEMVDYRSHSERLWKRPFGDLYLARGGLRLVDRRDAGEGFDACTSWLLERT
jgi:pseudaminic acid biosynthesis-associated methylase